MPERIDSLAVNPLMMLPFVALLAMIALAPLFFSDWWGRHYPKVAGGLALAVLAYYFVGLHAGDRVGQVEVEAAVAGYRWRIDSRMAVYGLGKPHRLAPTLAFAFLARGFNEETPAAQVAENQPRIAVP